MVRVRFAPSPTGALHIGGVRTALFNYLFAKKHKGEFLLRIEDTDQNRYVEGAEEYIINSLNWLGLTYDEGVGKGGKHAPYRQSERKPLYRQYAEQLIANGWAYYAFDTAEELDILRKAAEAKGETFIYNWATRATLKNSLVLPSDEVQRYLAAGNEYVVRFKMPDNEVLKMNDMIRGEVVINTNTLDDKVLFKSDGMPTYHLANIVDDHLMEITHVIRGAEYIASTPRYLSLYDALEIKPPVLACSPHIMAPSGNKKLGKRDGAKSADEYRKEGILPEAMMSFLASLGWNDGTEQEIFTKEELIKKFKLDRVQKSGARFDEKRLIWMNGQFIRNLNLDDLYERCQLFWGKEANSADVIYKKKVLALAQDRLKTLQDLPALTSYFFSEPKINLDLILNNKQLKKLTSEEQKKLLQISCDELNKINNWTSENIQNCLNTLLEITNQKPGILFSLIRIATTWAQFSPQLNDTLALLGKDKSLDRLNIAIKNIA